MDTHTNYAKERAELSTFDLLDGMAYLQSRVGVNFTITFLKTTTEWQFAIPKENHLGTKIRNRSFNTLISCAETYLAEAFKSEYGRDYLDAFTQERQIAHLENSVDQLTKENIRLGKLIIKREEDEANQDVLKDMDKMDKPQKEGKYAKLKRRIHKELFKRFKSININNPDDFEEYICIKSVEDIDKWSILDPSDYKREYANARQRLYWAKQQKKKGKKGKPLKKKGKEVRARKYGITDEDILSEMRRDYDNPWKAHKTKKWKNAFRKAKLRLYARHWNLVKNAKKDLPW